jgi:hypothetical protein
MLLNDLAGILYALNLHDEFSTSWDAIQNWHKINGHFAEPSSQWYKRAHSGDCTKEIHTCFVCLVEEFEGISQKLSDETDIDSPHSFFYLEKMFNAFRE